MYKLKYPLALLCLVGLLSGCMTKKDCQTANWHAIGYNDGAQGRPVGHLNVYSQRCAQYKITPNINAYRTGWGQGIRTYCTNANGFNAGAAGYAYNNVCPPDVAPNYLSGYRQGLRQYCSPDHALQLGLSGAPYFGTCPPDMAGVFTARYRLGQDLRRVRDEHRDIEENLDRVRRGLANAKDPRAYHELLERLSHLRHADEDSETKVAALNACASGDWFDAGLSDGEGGQPYRVDELGLLCSTYGIGSDPAGYRDGWERGNANYCSFDSGLYAGQADLDYHNVCHGLGYRMFWNGYMQGLNQFRAGHYAGHPRPVYRHERRRVPPAPRPMAMPRRTRQQHRPTIRSHLRPRQHHRPAHKQIKYRRTSR